MEIQFDVNAIVDQVIYVFWLITKTPIEIWVGLPWYVRTIVMSILGIIAGLFLWVTWKGRDEWRRRID